MRQKILTHRSISENFRTKLGVRAGNDVMADHSIRCKARVWDLARIKGRDNINHSSDLL
jgi:hypothetical protein